MPGVDAVKTTVERLLPGIWRLRVVLLGAFLLLIGVSAAYDWQQTQAGVARRAALEAGTIALAAQASVLLKPQVDALNVVVRDPRVMTALAGNDSERATLAEALQGTIPDALRLRLLLRGTVHIEPEASPPLTYASLDLLVRAETQSQPPAAEIDLFGTTHEHIALVRRIPAAGPLVGFVHLSVVSAPLRAALGALLAGRSLAFAEIRQPVPGAAPLILAQTGVAPPGALTAVTPIAGTNWLLATATPPPSTLQLGRLLTGMALLVALLGAAVVMRQRWALRAVVRAPSITVYQGAIKALLEGEHPGLAALLPGAGPVAPARPAVPPLAAAPVPHSAPPPPEAGTAGLSGTAVSPSIFRSYDIRGVVDETLTQEAVYQIGRAFGSEARARDQPTVVVARDGRVSSPAMRGALIEGLRDAGCDVVDIGLAPTPVLYFATHYLDTRTGVMITGSHNPAQYNGLKMVLDGEALSGAAIQAIRARIETQDFVSGNGALQEIDIVPDYIQRVSEEIPVALGEPLKIVVDCGNSVPGRVAPHILRAIGHDVIELYCDIDGTFPNHHPDPSQPENLRDLIASVRQEQADLGLAFDGDGDRLGVVDGAGNIIWPDRQLMLFARDMLTRQPGAKVIYDVKCTRLLADVIRAAGGEPIMTCTGHSLIKQKMIETGALLAGEMSGHLFFRERWYGFDDALYSAARLLEILVEANQPPLETFAALPQAASTPELRLAMAETRHATFMQQVREALDFPDAELIEIDGLRIELAHSWALIRPSNTTPCLVLRFEGDDEMALAEIQTRFRTLLRGIDPNLILPF